MEPKAPSSSGGPSPESTGPSLPSPEIPGEVVPDQQVEKAPSAPEVERPAGEGANQNSGMVMPAPATKQVVQPQLPASDDDDSSSLPTITDTPDLADDIDVIEKEWVDKAKQIVTDNVDDPHKQNHHVSILKADYMKKRYGKDIKVPGDKANKSK